MDDAMIFVTAFKDIGRAYRSNDKYFTWFYNLASNIDYNLVVFIEQEIKYEILKKYKFGHNVCFVDFNSVETFYHKYLMREEEIIQSDIYKHKIPTVRKAQIEHTSAKYNMITHTKVNFVKHCKQLFPSHEFYTWIDFGYVRDLVHVPKNINTALLPHKIIFDCYDWMPSNRIDANEMLSRDDIFLACGSFIVHTSKVELLEDLYEKKIVEWQANMISDDDQSLILQVYFDNPHLFHLTHSKKWFSLFTMVNAFDTVLISYDNATNTNTKHFINTLDANIWNYRMIGEGERWEGFVQTRMTGYLRAISKLPSDTLVVLSDARDVVCVRPPNAFKTGFLSYGGRIIVSMELFCEGHMSEDKTSGLQCIPLTNYWKHYTIHDKEKPPRKFANAGLLAGYAKDLKHMFTWILENKYTDDQLGVCNYMNTFPQNVYADIHAELLHTTSYAVCSGIVDLKIQASDSPTFSEILGSSSFFIHVPGHPNSKGQKYLYDSIVSTLTMLNNTKLNTVYKRPPPGWHEINVLY
jgi:hypothetical protein